MLLTALFPEQRDHRRDQSTDQSTCTRSKRCWLDEHSIRSQSQRTRRRRNLPDRSKPTRLAHSAVRCQSNRQRHRVYRRAGYGGRTIVQLPASRTISRKRGLQRNHSTGRSNDIGRSRHAMVLGQRGCIALCPLPGCGHNPWARNALDR